VSDVEALFLVVAGFLVIFGFIAYIKALANAAKNGKWAWFVLMLLFWPLFCFYYMGAYKPASSSGDG